MTTLATPSAPTLLGKLRALEEQANGPESWIKTHARDDIADLLPAVIAEIERLNATVERMSKTVRLDTAQVAKYGAALDTIATSTLSLPLCRRLAYNTLRVAIDAAMGE